jgi:hypothetical protein
MFLLLIIKTLWQWLVVDSLGSHLQALPTFLPHMLYLNSFFLFMFAGVVNFKLSFCCLFLRKLMQTLLKFICNTGLHQCSPGSIPAASWHCIHSVLVHCCFAGIEELISNVIVWKYSIYHHLFAGFYRNHGSIWGIFNQKISTLWCLIEHVLSLCQICTWLVITTMLHSLSCATPLYSLIIRNG